VSVERINISPSRFFTRNECSNTTFDTDNQYIKTDNTCSFVFDYAVSAPRPNTQSSMGECTGTVVMHDDVAWLSACNAFGLVFDCCFAFNSSGYLTVEETLYSNGHTSNTFNSSFWHSKQPYFVLDIYQCCMLPAGATGGSQGSSAACFCCQKVYCWAPGLGFRNICRNNGQIWNKTYLYSTGAINSNCTGFRWCGIGACEWGLGDCYGMFGTFYPGPWTNAKGGKPNRFCICVNEYSQMYAQICRAWLHCIYKPMQGPQCCFSTPSTLPVSLEFCTTGCLPLTVTC
jgi:hypothetical protein